MLTIDQLKRALNDSAITEAELEELCQACNALAEIFLEHRSDVENSKRLPNGPSAPETCVE